MFFSNLKGALIRTFFYSRYSQVVLGKMQQALNTGAHTNRNSICISICQVMILVTILQSSKLIAVNEFLSLENMRLHLLNLGIHLCLFWRALVLLKAKRFNIGRNLFIFSFCSYLSIASILWHYDLRLQYYFLLALFISSYLIDSHEKALLIVCVSYQLIAFIGFTWHLPNVHALLSSGYFDSIYSVLQKLVLTNSIVFAVSCFICAFFIKIILSQNWQQLRAYEKEQNRLIDQVFPNDLGTELLAIKTNKHAHLYQHKKMAVLFLDICGFTQKLFTQQTNWQSIFALFGEFDKLTAHLDRKRIKTNGDQYILVIGLQSESLSEKQIALQAIEASILIAEHTNSMRNCRVRQGLSLGNVVYGIFDTNNPVFDVWGETVVTAARLESFAEPAQILVDQALYLHTRDKITYAPCNIVNLKGIGHTQSYAVAWAK